ncbi:MAG: VanW family protein [Lachnospiraceae bacterium]|jgi:vancomycin resistance protein YoaR|nr:VanW family protein [Lachnospiraceae bacterium]MEE3461372.1 VanW family protein [Lachnospiraceae bacterium]
MAEYKRRVRQTKKKSSPNIKFLLLAAFIIAAAFILVYMISGMHSVKKGLIADGISISKVNVGGMSKEEAESAVNKKLAGITARTVTADVNGGKVDTTLGNIGLEHEDVSDAVESAYKVGRTGSIFKRSADNNEAKAGKKNIDLSLKVSEDGLRTFIASDCAVMNVPAKNSRLVMKDGVLKATRDRTGVAINVEETYEEFSDKLNKDIFSTEPAVLTADCEVTEPKYKQEEVSKCTDLLGEFSTSYASSTADRCANVENAVHYINGRALYPGRVLSVNKTIKDRTVENGYHIAAEYREGEVVDGVGGGVCQVSTTLYNAVIRAELQVVERHPHSMPVHYVALSDDAAIAGDYKDFKFRNNLDLPIFIIGTASGGIIHFQIYGHETRDPGRTLGFESETLETLDPGEPKTTVDNTKPADYREEVKKGVTGYKVRLWKIVYENGTEVSREVFNNSIYYPSRGEVIVGGGTEASPAPEKDDEGSDGEAKEPTEGNDKPGKTDNSSETGHDEQHAAEKTPAPSESPAASDPVNNEPSDADGSAAGGNTEKNVE